MAFYDFNPSGYREWFVNSNKYYAGSADHPQVMPSQKVLDIAAMTVLEAQIPYTWYTVDSDDNQIFIAKTSGTGVLSGSEYTLTIPPGNYTPATMTTALTTLLPVNAYTGAASTYPMFSAVTYSETTGMFTVTPNSNIFSTAAIVVIVHPTGLRAVSWNADITANSQPLTDFTKSAMEPLGISDITAPVNLLGTGGTALTFPMMIALGGPAYIAIRGNFGFGGNQNLIACDDSLGAGGNNYIGNILAFIPVNTIPGGTICWKNMSPRGGFFDLPIATLEQAEFWITAGDNEKPLALNGHSFQFKLGFIVGNRSSLSRGSNFTGDRRVTTSSMY